MSRLHFFDSGSFSKTLVFQHGLAANSTQVSSLFDPIDQVRILSFDCPGHGQSFPKDDEVYSFDNYADRLIHELDVLKIKKSVFGGISMGSGIALNIAMRYPERVEGLLLVRPAWMETPVPSNLSLLLHATEFIGKSNGVEAFLEHPDAKAICTTLPKAGQSLLGVFSEHQQGVLPQVIKAMVNDVPFSNTEGLQELPFPTLIVGNENDPLHPFEMAKDLSSFMVNSNLVKIPSRYVDPAIHRKAINDLTIEFLSTVVN